jgi:hypothetical protein
MTDLHHPITPPPELVEQWDSECESDVDAAMYLATQAARWGANQELEACCEWLDSKGSPNASRLRAARRPKPPSLKAQALEELEKVDMLWDTTEFSQETLNSLDTIRRALKQLPDHE